MQNVNIMEEEAKLNGFINAVYQESPYGIIVFTKDLDIVDWNPAVETLVGKSKEDCVGKNVLEVFAPSLELGAELEASAVSEIKVKGTLVVAEAIASHFAGNLLNGIKISVIVDKSGSVNGGTLILTPKPQRN